MTENATRPPPAPVPVPLAYPDHVPLPRLEEAPGRVLLIMAPVARWVPTLVTVLFAMVSPVWVLMTLFFIYVMAGLGDVPRGVKVVMIASLAGSLLLLGYGGWVILTWAARHSRVPSRLEVWEGHLYFFGTRAFRRIATRIPVGRVARFWTSESQGPSGSFWVTVHVTKKVRGEFTQTFTSREAGFAREVERAFNAALGDGPANND